MKVGISISNFSWPIPLIDFGPTVARIARTADEAGIDSLWVMDHFFQIRVTGEPTEAPITEAYATLSFLAGQTQRATLGTLVTSVSYRHPGVLLKTVTALDVLSGGRAVLGIGAGAPWNPEPAGPGTRFEAEGLGIPFPPLAERFERLEETLQIAHQMWRDDETPFRGRHYDLARPLNSPNSLQRPHPPILIGGSGERKTLRLVAKYGDACSLFDLPGSQFADNIEHKLGVLRRHCPACWPPWPTWPRWASTTCCWPAAGPGPRPPWTPWSRWSPAFTPSRPPGAEPRPAAGPSGPRPPGGGVPR